MLVDGWLISGGILDIKIEIFTGVQKPDLSACYQVILNTVGPLTDTAVCAVSIPYTVTDT
jgi:hypothetical protein